MEQKLSIDSIRSLGRASKLSASVRVVDNEAWRQYALVFSDFSYRLLRGYSVMAARRVRATSEAVGIFLGEAIIGLADVRVRRVPLLPIGIAYVSGGPVTCVNGKFDGPRFAICLEALCDEYVGRRRLTLRVTPPIMAGENSASVEDIFGRLGFVPRPEDEKYQTILKSISGEEESLVRSLDKKWRSELVRSRKSGATVRRSTQVSDFDAMMPIFENLRQAKGFSVNMDVAFFRDVQEMLSEGEELIWHLAELDGDLVAGHLGSYSGNVATYLLGAANDKGRANRSSYMLQWEAMCYAASRGMGWYDLGGIDPIDNPDVYRFKRRMGGYEMAAAGPYERHPSAFAGATLSGVEWALDKARWLSALKR
ncbi:peptidoglycan bridge formation glycyltransferase FemA/FemB family protein [Parvibaculum sp.]|uniref:lipid II:glycine glycyltransferase FemX n=1 Tax=Parvibaculum sp. TaxID=2024848 RepID=UPI001D29F7B2|nr:peptidoglycan bridge formation glycyltransferase FemA/FemB family protein [Parvibaculum sp.]MBX3489211.1 peptidoglycan bridge formation glycyltransferase FemA/FemB family protein [Parvibaculum sp.]